MIPKIAHFASPSLKKIQSKATNGNLINKSCSAVRVDSKRVLNNTLFKNGNVGLKFHKPPQKKSTSKVRMDETVNTSCSAVRKEPKKILELHPNLLRVFLPLNVNKTMTG